ncbi:SLOG family protein [Streptomyces sp. NPDC093149]|uniref:SLOG family protein n=1 Tax=Streptomyces sp. NPDC093149 TaxID=3366031 RepID=UPI0038019C8A
METAESQGEETRMIAEMIPDSFSHVVLVTGSRSWNDERSMRDAFNDAWRSWGAERVTRPVLLSGHCREGADVMAERLWQAADFEVIAFPADWSTHGRAADFQRNHEMVDAAQVFRDAGAQVLCARPSSTSVRSPDARSGAGCSSCRIHRGTSRTAPSTADLARELRGSRQSA